MGLSICFFVFDVWTRVPHVCRTGALPLEPCPPQPFYALVVFHTVSSAFAQSLPRTVSLLSIPPQWLRLQMCTTMPDPWAAFLHPNHILRMTPSWMTDKQPFKLQTSPLSLSAYLICQVSLICNRHFDIILILRNLSGSPGEWSFVHCSFS
jgi:hypothetical protein